MVHSQDQHWQEILTKLSRNWFSNVLLNLSNIGNLFYYFLSKT